MNIDLFSQPHRRFNPLTGEYVLVSPYRVQMMVGNSIRTSITLCCVRRRLKKFMVGYEMLAEAQRNIRAETAAECLWDLPVEHYKSRLIGRDELDERNGVELS
jgi:galactose-1-phosphate uridylyltransferase